VLTPRWAGPTGERTGPDGLPCVLRGGHAPEGRREGRPSSELDWGGQPEKGRLGAPPGQPRSPGHPCSAVGAHRQDRHQRHAGRLARRGVLTRRDPDRDQRARVPERWLRPGHLRAGRLPGHAPGALPRALRRGPRSRSPFAQLSHGGPAARRVRKPAARSGVRVRKKRGADPRDRPPRNGLSPGTHQLESGTTGAAAAGSPSLHAGLN
jgi:hypothetical protein